MADTKFVNTSGWQSDEIQDLDEMVLEDGNTDRSKFIRGLVRTEKKRRERRAEYMRLARKLRNQRVQAQA